MKEIIVGYVKALVDEEDFEDLMKVSWSLTKDGYAWCNKYRSLMHRWILSYFGPLIIDHIDGNKLNNQKCNLRIVTQKENQLNRKAKQINNTSGYTGVCLTIYGFQSYINVNGSRIHIGYFDTAELANSARIDYIKQNQIDCRNA